MATEHTTRVKCDRCKQTITETDGHETNSPDDPTLTFTFEDAPPISFKDLCDSCSTRCAKLMDDVRNGKKGKRKDTPDKEPTS